MYTKVGATYGRSALVDTDREFSIYVSVCLIKPNRDLVEPIFLNTTMSTPAIKSQADRRIKGIGVPDLHLDQIQNFLVPLPPLEKQRSFAGHVLAIERVRTAQRASLARLEDLFAALQLGSNSKPSTSIRSSRRVTPQPSSSRQTRQGHFRFNAPWSAAWVTTR